MKRNLLSFRLLLAVMVVCLLATGCKKDSDDPFTGGSGDYYMKLKINGVQKEYRENELFFIVYAADTKLYSALIGCRKSATAGGEGIAAVLIDDKPFTANTYLDTKKLTDAKGNKASQLVFTYTDDKNADYGSLGFIAGLPPYTNVITDTKITITEITGKYVRGTFSGTWYKTDLTGMVTVTGGEFYLPVSP